jgi:hypothetical protein
LRLVAVQGGLGGRLWKGGREEVSLLARGTYSLLVLSVLGLPVEVAEVLLQGLAGEAEVVSRRSESCQLPEPSPGAACVDHHLLQALSASDLESWS